MVSLVPLCRLRPPGTEGWSLTSLLGFGPSWGFTFEPFPPVPGLVCLEQGVKRPGSSFPPSVTHQQFHEEFELNLNTPVISSLSHNPGREVPPFTPAPRRTHQDTKTRHTTPPPHSLMGPRPPFVSSSSYISFPNPNTYHTPKR